MPEPQLPRLDDLLEKAAQQMRQQRPVCSSLLLLAVALDYDDCIDGACVLDGAISSERIIPLLEQQLATSIANARSLLTTLAVKGAPIQEMLDHILKTAVEAERGVSGTGTLLTGDGKTHEMQ